MKRRAKLQRKTSNVDRVRDYFKKQPDASCATAAKDLHLTVQAVYTAKTTMHKQDKTATNGEPPLQEKDIVAISKIGVATTERILRLLKALEK